VPHLDDLLGGGLPRGALGLIVGPPGSGKTTIAAQMAVVAAQAGRKVLILTAFSEPVTKLIVHLRTLRFFDDALLGTQLHIFSLTQLLPQGLDVTADELRTLLRRERYSLVVLDGFRGVQAAGGDEQRARHFLYTMGAALDLLQATMLVTSEAEPRDAALYPEATTADVLLGVHYGLIGLRERRAIEVIKVRGLAKLPGLHALTLTAEGVAIYPRLETRVAPGPDDAGIDAADASRDGDAVAAHGLDQRAPFDLPELDRLLGGGLTRETATLLLGSPGAGKTLLALHWVLAGTTAGEPAVYLGFRENRRQFLHAADTFGLGATLRLALAPGGPLTFVRLAPVELDPDILADRLLTALDRTGAQRLVIDSIGELERAVAEGGVPQRVPGYVAGLVEALRARSVTTLSIRESDHIVGSGIELATDTLAALAENVLLLQYVRVRDGLHRVIAAPKMRFSAHDLRLREFTIAPPEGIRVLTPFETEAGVLSNGDPAARGAIRSACDP
jgi:circadian clock protein KaiC